MTCLDRRAVLLSACLAIVPSTALRAQDTLVVPPDTTAVAGDSAAPHQADAASDTVLPPSVLPTQEEGVPPGPLAPGMRYTFTRDSVLWSDALTLADLLATIPGVYVARSGFVGQPSHIQYAGRGGADFEVYWDGMRWDPLGLDSLAVDPDRLPLSYLRRVDVEALPGVLRVFLVSERHEKADTRSVIRVTSGAFKTARYTAMFQRRWPGGVSLDAAGDYLGTDGQNNAAGASAFDLWAKVGWNPTSRVGASYQVRRQEASRDPVASGGSLFGVPALEGTRTDYLLTLYADSRDDALGFHAEGGMGVSAWASDSGFAVPSRTVRQAWAHARYQSPRVTVSSEARLGDAYVPLEATGRLGLVPVPGIVLSGSGRIRRLAGARTAREANVALGLYRGPLSVSGELQWQHATRGASLENDTLIDVTDRSVRAAFDTRPLSTEVRLLWRDGFLPLPYAEIGTVPAFAPTEPATYLVTDVVLRPIGAVSLSGSYVTPISGTAPDLKPPDHVRAALTLRSKYWRTFRSGAFDLKVQVAMESWADGTAGLSQGGTPIPLPAATFWEYHLEIQLVDFTIFWNLRNARLVEAGYVPGLLFPKNAQTFGITWVFQN